jgi:ethanolamine utilization protein EutN
MTSVVIRQEYFVIHPERSMFLARVTGHVVATQKDKTLSGQKLFVVEPLNVQYDEKTKQPAGLGNTNRAIVAIDSVGAGEGQIVLIVQGSSARMTEQTKNLPADAVIVGIVDSATYAGKTLFQAGDS